MTAGAPPPSTVLGEMAAIGFDVTHVYGLTETYGHVTQCVAQPDWSDKSDADITEIKSRQGVGLPITEDFSVVDGDFNPVPHDGEHIGEIVLRGNTIMSGYLKNDEETNKAFHQQWFRTGDLGVIHPDQYIQVKDRLKDIIISGGENISSVEVENVLAKHPSVLLASVVAKPDDKWGEVPCAFIEKRRDDDPISADELIAFSREHLPGFKCPKEIRFIELPKTSTGKIKKYELRQRAKGAV